MSDKVLCVDDDPSITDGYQRALRKRVSMDTANDGEQALQMLADSGPYAVIVSDLKMPGMDGVQLLSRAKEVSPETVRIMLTGFADLQTAIAAVDQGNVFRLLTKPCSSDELAAALFAGIEQHRLVTAERELLQRTLSGTIKILIDILSMLSPDVFGRAQLLRANVRTLARALLGSSSWDIELAAMLSQIGLVSVPPALLIRSRGREELTAAEQEVLNRVPEVGRDLLANIPRLEEVAQIILYQHKHYNGGGHPPHSVSREQIPIGSRMLKVCLDMSDLTAKGFSVSEALQMMESRQGWYDPSVLEKAIACFADAEQHLSGHEHGALTVGDLRLGQTVVTEIVAKDGTVVVPAGQVLTVSLLEKVRNYARTTGVTEPIYVRRADASDLQAA
ncbi:MAG: response regulator [Fimbriimonadia bacterium]|jgi:response regulator RpfG family c-di-GMP phosphodiesterase